MRAARAAFATAITVLAAGLLAVSASATAPSRNLLTGFVATPDGDDLGRMVDAGAGVVRIDVNWAAVAPHRPAHPENPADPAYRFATIDQQVRDAAARGLRIEILFTVAPRWAEGADRPRFTPTGTWKPNPNSVGGFAHALAARYSGGFRPSPAVAPLPFVRFFEVWNEPNLPIYLGPQWAGRRPVSPDLYRPMLNAAYRGIKSVRRGDVVISGGTAPYGESRGQGRMRPLLFLRRLFCLRGGKRAATGCAPKAHLDVLAHHPIDTAGGPHHRAVSAGDAPMPDLRRVRNLLRAAERAGTIAPRLHHQLWATEFWWPSDPPNHARGVPQRRFARWIEEGLYVMWKQGASAAFNFRVRDEAYNPADPALAGQSGVYFNDGTKKRAYRAMSFPFVADRRSPAGVRVWGKSPVAGRLRIEQRDGRTWRAIKSVRVRVGAPLGAVFETGIRLRGAAILRAAIAGRHSLPWIVDTWTGR